MEFEKRFLGSLSGQETKILHRVGTYFRSPKMNLADKLIQARLIALHDMELGHFSNPEEYQLLLTYAQTLDHLLKRLQGQPSFPVTGPDLKYSII